NGFYNLWRRFLTLHGHRNHGNGYAGKTALKHAQHIANGSASGRSNYAYVFGKGWQGFFVGFVKQAFGSQFVFELIKGALQGAAASFLHMFGNDLIVATAFI